MLPISELSQNREVASTSYMRRVRFAATERGAETPHFATQTVHSADPDSRGHVQANENFSSANQVRTASLLFCVLHAHKRSKVEGEHNKVTVADQLVTWVPRPLKHTHPRPRQNQICSKARWGSTLDPPLIQNVDKTNISSIRARYLVHTWRFFFNFLSEIRIRLCDRALPMIYRVKLGRCISFAFLT